MKSYNSSHSFSHIAALASLGIRQSPRGLRETEPTSDRRAGTKLELLLEEASAKCGQPFLDDFFIVRIAEGYACQIEYLAGAEAEAKELIEEEVMQFIRSYQIFCLLLDITLLVCRNQLGLMGVSTISSRVMRDSLSTPFKAIQFTKYFTNVLGMLALTPYMDMWSPL